MLESIVNAMADSALNLHDKYTGLQNRVQPTRVQQWSALD